MDKQILIDTLITVVESGGSNYWAEFRQYRPDDGTVEVKDLEADINARKWVKVNLNTIERGVKRLASGKINVNTDLIGRAHIVAVLPDKADLDSELADCILQAGIFNNVIYG